MFKNITVFGSAAKKIDPAYKAAAFRFGQLIGENGLGLIFGVGDHGLMGEVYRGALHKHARIQGITTKKLLELQCEDPSLFKRKEKKIVRNLYKRKLLMFKRGDVMVILPGGWGTIDEFSDFAVSIQIKEVKKKPLIFLNTNGFWDAQKAQLERMVKDGTLEDNKVDYVGFVNEPEDILVLAARLQTRLDKTHL